MAKQDIIIELYYSGQWQDHASDVRAEPRIEVRRGSSGEQQQPGPATCKLRFGGWDFNPANVSSSLYGLIGRNTPLRVRYQQVAEGFEDATLDITTSDGPGTPNWARTQTEAHSGSWSFGAESVSGGTSTAVDITVPAGANAITFWARVGGNQGNPLDVLVDGTEVTSVLAESTAVWEQVTVDVTGASTVRLDYTSSIGTGDAFIDDLTFDDVRFSGEVSSWTPRQTLGGDVQTPDRWVDVVASDIIRRLGQGQDPLRSAPYRYATLGSPVAYWPMDDTSRPARPAAGSGSLVPRIEPGETPPRVPPEWATGHLAAWLPPSARVRSDGELNATIAGSGDWAVDALVRMPEGIDEETRPVYLRIRVFDAGVDEDATTWTLEIQPDDFFSPGSWPPDLVIQAARLGMPARVGGVTGGAAPLLDGLPHTVRMQVSDAAGDDADWAIYVDGTEVGSGTFDIGVASLPDLTGAGWSWTADVSSTPAAVDPWDIGHMMVWAGSVPAASDVDDAMRGHRGERAGRRIERLCDEQDVTFTSTGDLDGTTPLGPQYPDGLLAILREAAQADLGDLLGARVVRAVHYRTRRDRYNQTATLALDYAAAEVAPPLEPVVDDQATRNDVTVRRRGGGEARQVDDDGPLGVDAIGRYDAQVTVNVASDDLLADQASWRLHLGTVDETRFPRISVDLDASTGLVDDAAAVDVGDLITVDNLPAELTPDLARLLVLGYSETIGTHRRRITYVCAPHSPHVGGVWSGDAESPDPDEPQRYSPYDSTTAASFEAGTDTSLDVSDGTGGNDLWTTDSGDMPFDIAVAGVRLRVTAIGAATGAAQTMTVQQTPVNGVTGTIASGAQVQLWQPARWAL